MQVYEAFMELFDALPISCVVGEKYLAMHGGISSELNMIDEINAVNRFQEIPLDGLFCDFLWADPIKDENAKHGDFFLTTQNVNAQTILAKSRLKSC